MLRSDPLWEEGGPEIWAEVDFEAIYEEVIAPAADWAGYDVIRAIDVNPTGESSKMWRLLLYADLAIVDASTLNPNVMYRIGRSPRRPTKRDTVDLRGCQCHQSSL